MRSGDRRSSPPSRGTVAASTCRKAIKGEAGAWLWVGVEDAAQLHEFLLDQGVTIRMPPTNFPWALEFHLEDPDGNVLRIGSEPLETTP